ncbi:hypothetical protein KA093_00480 [Candidatus Saccharibacteria bacterium]|nr:hypothetical protein [Candidatus Saccharibacteria bacterium]
MIKRLQIRSLLSDRGYVLLLILMLLLVAVVAVLTALYVRPGELRIPVRYSRFDSKNYTLDQWYSLLNYLIFAMFIWGSHFLISAKLYQLKGRQFALGYVHIGIGVLAVTIVYFLVILKIVSLTQ